jgi:hypothetical protein
VRDTDPIRAPYDTRVLFRAVCAGEAACAGENLGGALSRCIEGGSHVRGQAGSRGKLGRNNGRDARMKGVPAAGPKGCPAAGEYGLVLKKADPLPRLESVVLSLTPMAAFDDRHRLGVKLQDLSRRAMTHACYFQFDPGLGSTSKKLNVPFTSHFSFAPLPLCRSAPA